ncbi:MAG TPA: adenosylmethionine--8-amino-7-oxononanoate transaminase [Nitrososphaeraceae archaeon]
MNNELTDKRYVWHPYTQMNDWNKMHIRIVKASGNFSLVDENGAKILDAIGNMWCNVWGHQKKEIITAMKKQLDLIPHSSIFGLASIPSLRLAKKMIKITRGMSKVFFTDNGSTAVEVSLKMAIQYWKNLGKPQKRKIISLKNGYHGDTIGCMSIGYLHRFFSPYRALLLNGITYLPSPTIRHEKYNRKNNQEFSAQECLEFIEKTFRKNSNISAAFIMESGAQIAGGIRIYPPGFQKGVSELCKKYDILLILDEIATGLGRLGNICEYASQKSEPDMVCYAKSLTAGYFPLAVTLTTKGIFNAFLGKYQDNKHLFHGHTFTGNALGCACALSNLDLYQRFNLMATIRENSNFLSKLLKPFSEFDIVSDIRHKGLLGVIELTNSATGKPITNIGSKSISQFIAEESLKRGVYYRSLGNLIPFVPPLAIGKQELARIVNVQRQIITTIRKSLLS